MRLTLNRKNNDYDYSTNELEIVRKLGQLEDIEEELGIDLITFFEKIKGTMTEDFIKHLIQMMKKVEQQ